MTEQPDKPPTDGNDLLALAEEAGQLGVFEGDLKAGTIVLSPRYRAMLGFADDFDGRFETWLTCVYREDQPRLLDEMEQAYLARAPKFECEFRIVRPGDGELRWIETRRLLFYNKKGRPRRVVGVALDITERKRAAAQLRAFTETLEEAVRARTLELEAQDEARRKAEEQLRQAQKMEAVGQLTGGVAHDFNNLLTVILGGLETIGRQLPELGASTAAQRIARARDLALQGAQRAATLTSRLLAFSRQQALDPKPTNVKRLIAGLSEMLRRSLGEAVQLETVQAGGLWLASVDDNQLENALLNLAVNARDAMPTGGMVTIETGNCYLDQAYVDALAEPVQSGQYVLIAVADTGSGMSRDALEHAFEPFFTTKPAGRGTGLGLSQVYGFVRQSSGHVRIYSEIGEGTTVKLYLPRHLGSVDVAAVATRTAPAGAIGRETILVVEDDEALRTYAVEVLGELGYHTFSAANGAAALAVLEGEPDIDLLFTDVVMPGGMNGRQLADEAVRQRPGLKVLFTSGYTRNAIIHHGRLDPGVNLISKPYTFADLSARVRAILDV
ncbi:response regulator [soil metagenome]